MFVLHITHSSNLEKKTLLVYFSWIFQTKYSLRQIFDFEKCNLDSQEITELRSGRQVCCVCFPLMGDAAIRNLHFTPEIVGYNPHFPSLWLRRRASLLQQLFVELFLIFWHFSWFKKWAAVVH